MHITVLLLKACLLIYAISVNTISCEIPESIFNSCRTVNYTTSDGHAAIEKITCKTDGDFKIESMLPDKQQAIGNFDNIQIKSLIIKKLSNIYFPKGASYLNKLNNRKFILNENNKAYEELIVDNLEIQFNGTIKLERNSFSSFADSLKSFQIVNVDSYTLDSADLINELKSLKSLVNLTVENSDLDIENILTNANLSSLRYLNLKNNAIRLVHNEDTLFSNLIKLEGLSLCGNVIKFIDSSKLEMLPANLFELRLNENEIEIISNGSFKTLKNLTYLNLASNRIVAINKNTFVGLERLRALFLDKNLITIIERATFDYLIHLETLSLAFNNIKSIYRNSISAMLNLVELNASFNKIDNIEDNLFFNLTRLRKIDFTNNHISSIQVEIIAGLPALEVFNLEENNFKEVKFYNKKCTE